MSCSPVIVDVNSCSCTGTYMSSRNNVWVCATCALFPFYWSVHVSVSVPQKCKMERDEQHNIEQVLPCSFTSVFLCPMHMWEINTDVVHHMEPARTVAGIMNSEMSVHRLLLMVSNFKKNQPSKRWPPASSAEEEKGKGQSAVEVRARASMPTLTKRDWKRKLQNKSCCCATGTIKSTTSLSCSSTARLKGGEKRRGLVLFYFSLAENNKFYLKKKSNGNLILGKCVSVCQAWSGNYFPPVLYSIVIVQMKRQKYPVMYPQLTGKKEPRRQPQAYAPARQRNSWNVSALSTHRRNRPRNHRDINRSSSTFVPLWPTCHSLILSTHPCVSMQWGGWEGRLGLSLVVSYFFHIVTMCLSSEVWSTCLWRREWLSRACHMRAD